MSLVPDLIVIGAQKCGTTTLWEDLRRHPRIYIGEKESRVLCGGPMDREELHARYARAFGRAESGSILGEVSTRYAMLPDDSHAAQNARSVSPAAKIVYIVRDPVDRIISHHHHDWGLGFVGPDIDEAIYSYPSLLDNTRYAMQVTPWLNAFGVDAVNVVKFEDYMADRRAGVGGLLRVVGVADPYDPGNVAYNAASTKHIAPGRWATLAQNPLYRRVVRPLMSESVRLRVNRAVLPKAPPRPCPPSNGTIQWIVDELAPEVEQLAELMGTGPMWDLAVSAARHRHTAS